MAFYEDLARCGYYRQAEVYAGLDLIAIGWLEAPFPYWRGRVPGPFIERLFVHLQNAWDPNQFRGIHRCDLCDQHIYDYVYASNRTVNIGAINLFVPKLDGAGLYVAPSLILHYVIDHDYRPPLEFQAAVMECPEMTSTAYFRQLDRILPKEHVWRDTYTGYWRHMGAALAREAGLMSLREWHDYSDVFRSGRTRFSSKDLAPQAPDWFAAQFIRPLTALAHNLEETGQADDAHAVRTWRESVIFLGRQAPADDSRSAPVN